MIYLGADHKGFDLKEKIKQWLNDWGYESQDCGAFEYNKDDDYPDFAKAVAEKIQRGSTSLTTSLKRGILICGSGIGICIAANKIKGIRAGTATTPEQIKAAVSDEDLNVLCLSADYTDENVTKEIIKTFLEAKFSGEERHKRRIGKIADLEK